MNIIKYHRFGIFSEAASGATTDHTGMKQYIKSHFVLHYGKKGNTRQCHHSFYETLIMIQVLKIIYLFFNSIFSQSGEYYPGCNMIDIDLDRFLSDGDLATPWNEAFDPTASDLQLPKAATNLSVLPQKNVCLLASQVSLLLFQLLNIYLFMLNQIESLLK